MWPAFLLKENKRGDFVTPCALYVLCFCIWGGIILSDFSFFVPLYVRLTNSDVWIKFQTVQYYLPLTGTFRANAVSLIPGRPSTWNPIYQSAVSNLFRSDHYRFWNAEPSLPAVFLTDSADFRGYMQQCYHKDCDDISHVTLEMVKFLGRTSDSLVKVATNMTNEKCQMKKTGKVMWPFFF